MPLDLSAVGRRTDPFPVSWISRDTMLYALGVGAGAEDPAKELQFTTENTKGVEQKVLPTFPVVLGFAAPRLSYGDVDRSKSVHAEQGIVVHRALKPEGRGFITSTIDGIYDKGSGALVSWTSSVTDENGDKLVDLTAGAFIRGAGGFNGERGPKSNWKIPERAPDAVIEQRTRSDQALLYRLSGDRNPLHSDFSYAAAAGWPRPILHGLCTFGFVGRAVLSQLDNDPSRLRSIKLRFSAPVLPGNTLTTSLWRDGANFLFRTCVGDRVVLDAGEAESLS